MAVIDDKSEHCVPFILDLLKQHREKYENEGKTPPPFFLGLNGVQGAGKTTLVRPTYISSLPLQEGHQ
jgi:D-glycerate 3-kinase